MRMLGTVRKDNKNLPLTIIIKAGLRVEIQINIVIIPIVLFSPALKSNYALFCNVCSLTLHLSRSHSLQSVRPGPADIVMSSVPSGNLVCTVTQWDLQEVGHLSHGFRGATHPGTWASTEEQTRWVVSWETEWDDLLLSTIFNTCKYIYKHTDRGKVQLDPSDVHSPFSSFVRCSWSSEMAPEVIAGLTTDAPNSGPPVVFTI